MGMYTVMCLNCNLRADTPTPVLDLLLYMMRKTQERPETLPDHPLFHCKDQRWEYLLSSAICYADGPPYCILSQEECLNQWEFAVHTSIKNYHQELEKFLDWIAPYIKTQGFIGYTRYEEADVPRLVFVYNGRAVNDVMER